MAEWDNLPDLMNEHVIPAPGINFNLGDYRLHNGAFVRGRAVSVDIALRDGLLEQIATLNREAHGDPLIKGRYNNIVRAPILLTAISDNRVVGSAEMMLMPWFRARQPDPRYNYGCVYFNTASVASKFRGNGVGTALTQMFFDSLNREVLGQFATNSHWQALTGRRNKDMDLIGRRREGSYISKGYLADIMTNPFMFLAIGEFEQPGYLIAFGKSASDRGWDVSDRAAVTLGEAGEFFMAEEKGQRSLTLMYGQPFLLDSSLLGPIPTRRMRYVEAYLFGQNDGYLGEVQTKLFGIFESTVPPEHKVPQARRCMGPSSAPYLNFAEALPKMLADRHFDIVPFDIKTDPLENPSGYIAERDRVTAAYEIEMAGLREAPPEIPTAVFSPAPYNYRAAFTKG